MSVCFYTPMSNATVELSDPDGFNSVVPEVNFNNSNASVLIKLLGLPYCADDGLCGEYATEELWSVLLVCDIMLGSDRELLDRLKVVCPATWQGHWSTDLNRRLISLREVIEFARVSGQPLIWN